MASSIDSRKSSSSHPAGYLKQSQQQERLNQRPTAADRPHAAAKDDAAAVNHIRQERRIEAEERAVQKPNDSFYKVHERGSRFYENGKNYVIEAYAPKEEKDNIRVTVQNDKAVISGHRQFNDEIKKGNKLTSTNNYQTFREEFSFKTPAAGQGLVKERDGDFIRFIIPKQGEETRPDEDIET